MDEPQNLPLVRCRDCCSPLLQPELVVGPIDGECLVVRFCPDCERRDQVVAADDAMQAWLRRDIRILRWMAAYADDLAERPAGDASAR